MKRIKLYESFLGESFKPQMIDTFMDAESELDKKSGLVLIGVTGDVNKVEKEVDKFCKLANFEKNDVFDVYILNTDKSGHNPASWKSDVFLVYKDNLMHDLTSRIDDAKDKMKAISISDYFNMNEGSNKYPLLDEVVENLSDEFAKLINEKSNEIKNDPDNKELIKKMPYISQYILEEVAKNLQKRV